MFEWYAGKEMWGTYLYFALMGKDRLPGKAGGLFGYVYLCIYIEKLHVQQIVMEDPKEL